MALEIHKHAELLMGRADQMSVEGRSQESAKLNCQAAEAEARVVALLPREHTRTRGIMAISSVALYRKGGALEQAIRQAEIFLKRDDLPDFARLDLEEMIEEMRAELDATAAVERLPS